MKTLGNAQRSRLGSFWNSRVTPSGERSSLKRRRLAIEPLEDRRMLSIVLEPGNIIFQDFSTDTIYGVDPESGAATSIISSGFEFDDDDGHDVAVAPNGDIVFTAYVGPWDPPDPRIDGLFRWDAETGDVEMLMDGDCCGGVAVAPNGNIIFQDFETDTIYQVDPESGAATSIISSGFEFDDDDGHDVAVAPNGDIVFTAYVGPWDPPDPRIDGLFRWDAETGDVEMLMDGDRCGGVAVAPNGDIIFQDFDTDTIYRVDPESGAATSIISSGFEFDDDDGHDVAVAPNGDIVFTAYVKPWDPPDPRIDGLFRWDAETGNVEMLMDGDRCGGVAVAPSKWTVMVYLDGDNNLEAHALLDFREMARVNNPNVTIAVQFDRSEGYSSAYSDWKDTRRGVIMPGDLPDADWGTSIGEKNMGNPETLEDFVDWARREHPAEYYALILWDHGDGWKDRPKGDGSFPKGICGDQGDYLETDELHEAIGNATNEGADPINVIGMDACLMAGLEVAYEIKAYGNLFVASAELVPGLGWPYDDILDRAHLSATTSPEAWSENIVTAYANYYADYASATKRRQTLMAADLDYIVPLSTAVSDLAGLLIEHLMPERSNIDGAWHAARRYSDDPDLLLRHVYQSYVDVNDFCDELRSRTTDVAIRSQTQVVMDIIDNDLLEAYWKNTTYPGSTDGQRCFWVYFPEDDSDYRYGGYDSWLLSFLKDVDQHWDEFLQTYFLPILSINHVPQPEGTGGTTDFVFNVALSEPSTDTVTVDFATANGTAVAGVDYQANSGTLTFAPGEQFKTIVVRVAADSDVEADETFTVVLSDATGATIGGGTGDGTIVNDDGGPFQKVSAALNGLSGAPGDRFSVEILYATSDSDQTLEGLGLRLHFDASVMSLDELTDVLTAGLVEQQPPADDAMDFDADPYTDKYILISWADPSGDWPNRPLPVRLFRANFALASDLAGGMSTAIRFSASSTPDSHDFISEPIQVDVEAAPRVTGRYVFCNNSLWDSPTTEHPHLGDDTAIAFHKEALLPGNLQATFENYTSYVGGINGIMVDVAGLPAVEGTIDPGDYFEFKVGNDDDPAGWDPYLATPTVSIRSGKGVGYSDRVTLTWPDYDPDSPETTAVAGQWLQVTVLADEHTGLAEPDVFCFGNAIGETGDSTDHARVDANDTLQTRNNPHPFFNPAGINCPYDFNRDGRVDAHDIVIARNHQTAFSGELELITVPLGKRGKSLGLAGDSSGVAAAMRGGRGGVTSGRVSAADAVFERATGQAGRGYRPSHAELAWLHEFEPTGRRVPTSKRDHTAAQALDALLASYR